MLNAELKNHMLSRFSRILAVAALALLSPPATANPSPCAEVDGAYTVCDFDAHKSDIRLFLRNETGETYGDFSSLAGDLARRGETLAFAMNAGMYAENRAPVGLYVESGRTLKSANTRPGPGNFHMKPNGVFWIDGSRAGVTETAHFLKSRQRVEFATQSGPMLVIGGRIHPRIHEEGMSRKFRNGVCVQDGHIARFAISNRPVTFYEFARLFRDRLHCQNALFLDGGAASGLYAPSLSRHDRFLPAMGPIVGVVEKAER
ncbi:MAG: phosphodiester glycosidase family protein [Methylocystis sp.]